MSFSNYNENYLLNLLFTNKTVYCSYGTAASESSITEPSGNAYARVAFGAWTLTSVAQDLQYVENDAAVTWPQSTGNQGTITHIGLHDALTGGNFLGSIALANLGLDPIEVISGTQISIDPQELQVQLD